MAVAIRQAKHQDNTTMTIQTLIDIHDGKVKIDTHEDDRSYQWNQFGKDFCANPINKQRQTKLQDAAKLWKIIRDGDSEKVYRTSLLKYL